MSGLLLFLLFVPPALDLVVIQLDWKVFLQENREKKCLNKFVVNFHSKNTHEIPCVSIETKF